jgi:osmotically-inducible protein OsmY
MKLLALITALLAGAAMSNAALAAESAAVGDARVETALADRISLREENVVVTTTGSTMVLTGDVASTAAAGHVMLAAYAAAKGTGITTIENQMTIRHP